MAASGARYRPQQAGCGLVWRPQRALRCVLPRAASTTGATHDFGGRRPIGAVALTADPTAAATAAAAAHDPSFEERCAQLDRFRRQHGHSRVPVQEPTGLGAWAARQRHAWRAGQLLPARQQALAALGLGPNAFEDAWTAHFAQLAEFHSRHGHCRVPRPPRPAPAEEAAADPAAGQQRRQRRRAAQQVGSEGGGQGQGPSPPGLYDWLQQQRMQWRRGTLPDHRRRRLEGLGVEFQAQQASWQRRYAQLLAFKEEIGHTDVPAQWPGNPGLADWVASQRRRWRGELGAPLTPSQLSRLQACGFRFQVQRSSWEQRYGQLCDLARQRGGSLGAAPLPAEDGLQLWTAAQLRQWRLGRLKAERAELLRALGLTPSRSQDRWQQRLAALDRLLAALGPGATHALLVLHPQPSVAADMAAAAAAAAASAAVADAGSTEGVAGGRDASSSSGSGPLDPAATAREAAEVVRWYRSLRARRRVAPHVAQALAARGLGLERQPAAEEAAVV